MIDQAISDSFLVQTHQNGEESDTASLQRLLRFESAINEFSLFALTAPDSDNVTSLMQQATTLAARALGAEIAKLVMLTPDRRHLVTRAGIGWRSGVAGVAMLPLIQDSLASLAVKTAAPIAVEDFLENNRVAFTALLLEHQIRSGVAAPILISQTSSETLSLSSSLGSAIGAFLCFYREPRRFLDVEIVFLSRMATLLGKIITRVSRPLPPSPHAAAVNEADATPRRDFSAHAGVVDPTLAAVITIDDSQKIANFNNGAHVLLGYEPPEAIGRSFAFLFPESQRLFFLRSIEKLQTATGDEAAELLTAAAQPGVLTALHRDGREIPVIGSIVRSVRDGRPSFTIILRDGQRNESAERALAIRERMLTVIATTLHAVFLRRSTSADGEMRFDYVGGAVESLFGCAAEAFLASPEQFFTRLHPDDRKRYQSALHVSTRTQRGFRLDVRVNSQGWKTENAEQTARWIQIAAAPFQTPHDKTVWNEVAIDVSDCKQKEHDLLHAQANFTAAERLAHLGNWEWDVDDDQMSWSDEVYAILGSSPETLTPSYTTLLGVIHPDDRGIALDTISRALGQSETFRCDLRLQLPNGGLRAVLLRGEVVLNAAGSPVRIIGAIQDVSEIKAAEQSLKANEELARTLMAAADAANRTKSEFLANMSHELRTPLNAILGFSQLLALHYDTTSSSKQASYVGNIIKGGQHLLRLIDDVLDLAKIDVGRIKILAEPVDVVTALEELYYNLQSLSADLNLTISFEPPLERLSPVYADRTRLIQILTNLGSNAVKYNRMNGRVILSAGMAPSGMVRLSVADTGRGVPYHRQKELFQPFNRLGAETGAIQGSGIGLALTRRLVQIMKGEIGFSSVPDQGSVFWIDLPPVENDEALDSVHTSFFSSISAKLGGFSLLCIESNPTNMAVMAALFDHLPEAQILEAPTIELGIELAICHQPDIIAVDVQLSGSDGFQVLETLQRTPSVAAIPVIALSSDARQSDIERGIAAGFRAWHPKPMDFDAFLKTLTVILNERRIASSSCR
ncbi:hypothetical protein CCP2SC5_250012 [Azospirillaceae bacterium]